MISPAPTAIVQKSAQITIRIFRCNIAPPDQTRASISSHYINTSSLSSNAPNGAGATHLYNDLIAHLTGLTQSAIFGRFGGTKSLQESSFSALVGGFAADQGGKGGFRGGAAAPNPTTA